MVGDRSACYVRENINFLRDKYKITEETEDYEKEEKEYEEKLGKLEERDLLEGLERMGEIDL